jgi:son of sevenless-like protein
VYNDTFLITFKSFTNVDELFDLLVERFNIPEPEGLSDEERKQWVSQKQLPIRVR